MRSLSVNGQDLLDSSKLWHFEWSFIVTEPLYQADSEYAWVHRILWFWKKLIATLSVKSIRSDGMFRIRDERSYPSWWIWFCFAIFTMWSWTKLITTLLINLVWFHHGLRVRDKEIATLLVNFFCKFPRVFRTRGEEVATLLANSSWFHRFFWIRDERSQRSWWACSSFTVCCELLTHQSQRSWWILFYFCHARWMLDEVIAKLLACP